MEIGEMVIDPPLQLDSPKISVLIVSYNTLDMTLACIRSVYEQTISNSFEIIVVDNASIDGSADAIEHDFPDVHLLRSKNNLGFARANNLAAKEAKGVYFLLLNPDTLILDRGIDKLASFAGENNQAGIWGGRTYYGDGTLNPTSCWQFMSIWSVFCFATGLCRLLPNTPLFNPEAYGGWSRDSVREVDIITGCFLLIDHQLWHTLNGFDEAFFMYAEEADLCYRAHKFGARPLFTPDATIIHFDGASETVFSAKSIRLFSGKVTFLNKHWLKPRCALGIALLKLSALIRLLCYATIAPLSRNARHRMAALEWQTIWSARRKWAIGYSGNSK